MGLVIDVGADCSWGRREVVEICKHMYVVGRRNGAGMVDANVLRGTVVGEEMDWFF